MSYASKGFTKKELTFIQNVLDDPRAWNVKFTHVKQNPDFVIYKTPGSKIDEMYPPHIRGLSVTDRSERPWKIHFRKENWDAIPEASGYTNLDLYRVYLILHEFGHILGHGHSTCAKKGPAPVMMQQTKGTGVCWPDPWVQHEKKVGPRTMKLRQKTIIIEDD
jgi:hypothetical protein